MLAVMSSENIQHQIEFILEHQAKFSEDLDRLKEVQAQQAANIDRLTADVQELTVNVNAMRAEMREGFENLIVANEATRDLANKVAELAM